MDIFGIKIDTMSKPEAQKRLAEFFVDGAQHLITTPNPEILLASRHDEALKTALNTSSLNMPDGFGLLLMMKLFGVGGQRYPGVELSEYIVQVATENKEIIYFLGDAKGSAEKAAMKFPHAHIIAEAGPNFNDQKEKIKSKSEEIISRVNNSGATVVLAAFGHPWQEKWLHEHLAQMPSVKIAIGVGGTFDFWSGAARRAPAFLRSMGLEWLWRLLLEPRRWKRIFNAVAVFPFLVIVKR